MRKTRNVYTKTSAAVTTNGNSGDLQVGDLDHLGLDVDVSAASGTNPTLTFFLERKGSDDVYYPIYSPAALTAVGKLTAHIGPLQDTNVVLGDFVRLRWVIGGTATPTFTFTASIKGQY